MATNIVDISQVNMKELIRDMKEKEAIRLLKQVIENNIKTTKTVVGITKSRKAEKKKRTGKRMEKKGI